LIPPGDDRSTDPSSPAPNPPTSGPPFDSAVSGAPSDPVPAPPPPSFARPGSSTFTIEGRRAPGLFVVGWLATILGLGVVLIGALSSSVLLFYFVGPLLLTIGLCAGAGSQALERGARGEAYAGPSPFLVFAAAVAATYFLASVLGTVLSLFAGTIPGPILVLVIVVVQSVVFLSLVRLLVVGTEALSWREMGIRTPDASTRSDVGFGALLALPIIGVTLVLAAILVSIIGAQPDSPIRPTGTPFGAIVNLLATAIIAPTYEEVFFRGFALTAWQRSIGNRGALVRSSLLFAVAHVISISGTSFGQVVGAALVGFAVRLPIAFTLGWVFLRRGTIWAPLALHVTYNAILVGLAELARSTIGG
jgi:membrane protease YdiL (CAAX protease family)